MDHAAPAVKAMHPGDRRKRKVLLEWIRSELKASRVDQVITFLEPHRHLEAVQGCVTDYTSNRDRMRYDDYRRRGMQIGNGAVESACRHAVGQRMKRSGSRWSVTGANAILSIRCRLRNLRWPDFLDWSVRQTATA